MTGNCGGRGRFFMDFDSHKNQEWLRRRKLRLEQVRKQSSEIARILREKVVSDEKFRLEEFDRISEANLRDWKADKLDELEWRLRSALEEFGEGYKLAEEEPDAEEIIEEKNKVNFINAQKRGEIAQQEAHRAKKLIEEKKKSPILRKKLTRKKEDLRSALIRSVPTKNIFETQEVNREKNNPENLPVSGVTKKVGKSTKDTCNSKKKSVKLRRKGGTPHKSCLCKQTPPVLDISPRKSDTVWVNLNEIQSSSTGEFGLRQKSTESFVSCRKNQKEKPEGTVEFYDFSSRFHCRTFKEFPHLVERVNSEEILREPNATELAKMEDENVKREAKRKQDGDLIVQERGMEALRREKITRDYSNLLTKLDELNRKEKVLKFQQRNHPSFLHMSDDRLSERLKTRQRIMDSKFENIYYEAMSQIPVADSPNSQEDSHRQGGGDWAELNAKTSACLSLAPSNLKPNSPVMSDLENSGDSSPPERFCRLKKTKKKRHLLKDIEKTLREGRELRQSVSRNWTRLDDFPESQTEDLDSPSEEEKGEGEQEPSTKSQECQTDLKDERNVLSIDLSLPVSTSTCYKSPPSVRRSHRVQEVLDYLEGISEPEEHGFEERKQTLRTKIDKVMYDLLHDGNSCKSEEKGEKSDESQTLEYYIGKLLTMSRECIADLSVSSENVSTPNITDVDLKEQEMKCLYQSSSGEELIRQSRLKRANQLEEMIKNWKQVYGRGSFSKEIPVNFVFEGDSKPEPEDVPDCPNLEEPEELEEKTPQEPLCVLYNPKIKSRYEEITRKCSERISELSQMLDKVRRDKEKLLNSASGGSSLNLSKDGKDSDFEEVKPEEDLAESKDSPISGSVCNGYRLERKDETTSIATQSHEPEESMESWPDIMEELLKRKILSSPFKWSNEQSNSSDLMTINDHHPQPSSIETAIGNFRNEINKIKPFTVSDSFSQSNSPQKRHVSEERHQKLCFSPRRGISFGRPISERLFQEETSVESINYALTSLGLNWAKSFLRKNEESKAMSSSSNSEGKSSDGEDRYP